MCNVIIVNQWKCYLLFLRYKYEYMAPLIHNGYIRYDKNFMACASKENIHVKLLEQFDLIENTYFQAN